MTGIQIGGKRNLSDGTWDYFWCRDAVDIERLGVQLNGNFSKLLL